MVDGKHAAFIIVNGYGEACELWNEILADCDRVGSVTRFVMAPVEDRITWFFTRRKIQKLTGGIFTPLLIKRFPLYDIISKVVDDYEQVYVLFLNCSFSACQIPLKVLEAYKKMWKNLKYVLLYADGTTMPSTIYVNFLRGQTGLFDRMYTFDAKDAKNLGMQYCNTYYSKCLDETGIQIQNDLYFCGVADESRHDAISSVFSDCKKNGVSLDADIKVQYGNINDFSGARSLTHFLPYKENIRRMLHARCILDIVKPGHTGLSLRIFEAVNYNRKLLTNNKSILNFPYYDSRYMQYFERIEDIDWAWVKEDVDVDYHYKNDFSPLNLLADIQACLNSEE